MQQAQHICKPLRTTHKNMFKILALITGLIISEYSFAQSDSSDLDIDINIKLMKSTFCIGGEGSCGTGFIMLRKNKNLGGKSTDLDIVFITAAHVLDSIKGNKAIIYLRKEENNIYTTIPCPIIIRKGNKNFYKKHPSMDIAVMFVTLLPGFDYKDILNETWLANDTDLVNYKIRTGETLNCLGFPMCIYDTIGNFPILRSGKIASYPLIPTNIYKTFSFDFEVYAGNSGGPVYFFKDGINPNQIKKNEFKIGGRSSQLILGLITQQKYVDTRANNGALVERTYLKLGVVIQAPYILETIKMLE